jgi:hypothetical protein
MKDEKRYWLEQGLEHCVEWCTENLIEPPTVHVEPGRPNVASCAYYREGHIWIYPKACATLGYGGPAWSWPGYLVDRTPYGVLAHELGHHVDCTKYTGRVPRGVLSDELRRKSKEPPITSYCPDTSEWFAEMFRLFVTNPDLLKHVRPMMFALLDARFDSVETRPWQQVLRKSKRHLDAVCEDLACIWAMRSSGS